MVKCGDKCGNIVKVFGEDEKGNDELILMCGDRGDVGTPIPGSENNMLTEEDLKEERECDLYWKNE